MSYDLPALCRQVRRDILTMTHAAGSGHPGGSLSAVEILVTLYFDQMHLDPAQPGGPKPGPVPPLQGPRRPGALQRPGPAGLL